MAAQLLRKRGKSKQSRIIELLHYNEQTNNDPNLPFKYYTNQPRDKNAMLSSIKNDEPQVPEFKKKKSFRSKKENCGGARKRLRQESTTLQ